MIEQPQVFAESKALIDLRSLLLHLRLTTSQLSDCLTLMDQVEKDFQSAKVPAVELEIAVNSRVVYVDSFMPDTLETVEGIKDGFAIFNKGSRRCVLDMLRLARPDEKAAGRRLEDGYVSVPLEPSSSMLDAAFNTAKNSPYTCHVCGQLNHEDSYIAMIQAVQDDRHD